MHKSVSEYRDGYKAHIAVEPETGLVTACDLTPANVGDGPTGVALLSGEKPGLQVLADAAYGSGEVRAMLRADRHTQAIKPIPLRRAIPGGFDRDDFIIDHDGPHRNVSCRRTPCRSQPPETPRSVFDAAGCPLREHCTTRRGRQDAPRPRTRP